ncbi:putative oxidoreductase CipA [Bombardia bombarda]|uniref:Oxidoreductase CipA n=1 Tax=Bombardia bombarda TaxID=252184 RepID=A0AA39X920_9PEZI|nr:putative oxidoreductase CipA [Bombardia bombarda]
MAQKYAKDQPAGFTNRIERVAIVGAGGHAGKPITTFLLKTGKHTVTALARSGSEGAVPAGCKIATVDYDNEASLVAALTGQQFFVITVGVSAPPDTHHKLVTAAAKAGVPYVMTNCYGVLVNRPEDVDVARQLVTGEQPLQYVRDVEEQGVSAWIAMSCSFWYEWSLALAYGIDAFFGINIKERKAIFFDDGKRGMSVSTWEQTGRAMAALLSLKELPEDENDTSPTVSHWRNKPLKINSFVVSQRDMLDSLHRTLGTTDADWTIEYQPAAERYQKAMDIMKTGFDRPAFARAMYTRVFFPDLTAGGERFHYIDGSDNEKLGLAKDDLDAATKRTVDMVNSGWVEALWKKMAGGSHPPA